MGAEATGKGGCPHSGAEAARPAPKPPEDAWDRTITDTEVTPREVLNLSGVYLKKILGSSMAIVLDSLNSIVSYHSGIISEATFETVRNDYQVLFGMLSANFQKVVYISSPEGSFWEIDDPAFDHIREHLAEMAKRTGIFVVPGLRHGIHELL